MVSDILTNQEAWKSAAMVIYTRNDLASAPEWYIGRNMNTWAVCQIIQKLVCSPHKTIN